MNRLGFPTAIVTALVVLSAAYWLAAQPFVFPLDDAYITIHNAQALLSGSDLAYGVSPLIGATSLVHLALVTIATFILPPILASYVVAVLGTAAYALGLLKLAAQAGLTRLETGAVLLVGLGAGFTSYQLMNGLETVWAMAAVAWAIALARAPSRALAALCGVLPFIRPELAVLSALLFARQAYLRRDFRGIAVDIGVAACAAAPWLIWSWSATGAFLPSTADAKAAFFAEAGRPLMGKIATLARALAGGVGILLLPLLLVRRSSLALVLWTFLAVFLAVFAATFPGGLFHNFFRYQFVLLPVAAWALCELQTRPSPRRLALPICAALAAVTLPGGLEQVVSARVIVQDGLDAAAWAQANLPHGARVLVHDAGEIAYASTNLKLIDVVGLKRPASIPPHRRFTLPSTGAERWRAVDAIAREAGAQYAEILGDYFWGALAQDLRRAGWGVSLVYKSPVAGGYNIFRLEPPPVVAATN